MSEAPIIKTENVLLEQLLNEISCGELRVPKFHGSYLWKHMDMLTLFDSIYKGYPIGNLLLWTSLEPIESFVKVGLLSIPQTQKRRIAYIIEGYHRLLTLFVSLFQFPNAVFESQQEAWRWWIGFDLNEQIFVHVPNSDPEAHLLPLRAVLRTVDFLDATRKIQQKSPETASALIKKAELFSQKIKLYKVIITRIRGGTFNQVIEMVSRLNKPGQNFALLQNQSKSGNPCKPVEIIKNQ